MSDPAIKDACAAARSYDFQLFDGREHLGVSTSDEYRYMDHCQNIFEDAKKYQRRVLKKEPDLPTASYVRKIGEFVKKHNLFAHLNVRIVGYDDPISHLELVWGYRGFSICVHPCAPAIGSGLLLIWGLGHEYGHARDIILILINMPEWIAKIEEGEVWYNPKYRELISTTIKLMRKGLSKLDQIEFDGLKKDVLGDLDSYDGKAIKLINIYLGEVFRAGEEILDERLEDVMMEGVGALKKTARSEDFYLKRSITNHRGERVDLWRLMLVATLQEAGLWEKFIQHPDYDPNSIRYIKPNHLNFFRLCIRGATRYFINTAAR